MPGTNAWGVPFRAHVAACVLVAYTLLAPPSLAQDVDAALAVEADEGALWVTLEADAASEPTSLVVSHEDPLLGTVIDRIVPIDLSASIRLRLQLHGLRPDAALDVRLVRAISDVANASAAQLDRGLVARAPAVQLPPLGSQPFEMHLVDPQGSIGSSIESVQRPVALASAEGDVAIAWCHEGWRNTTERAMRIAFSRDGGRTIVGERTLAAGVDGCGPYALVDHRGGVATLLVSRARYMSAGALELVRVPLDETAPVERRSLSQPLTVYHFGATRAHDGRILVAHHQFEGKIQMHLVDAEGTVADAGTILAAPGGPLRIGHAGDSIVLGWRERDVRDAPRIAWSLDGGRSFSSPSRLPLLEAATDQAGLSSVGIDEEGRIHVVARGTGTGNGATSPDNPEGYRDAYYARVSGGVNDRVQRLTGDIEGSLSRKTHNAEPNPAIAVAGPRVWISWYTLYDSSAPLGAYSRGERWLGAVAVESTDGGETFAQPVHLAEPFAADGKSVYSVESIEVLPDGRPLLLVAGFGRSPLYTVPVFDPLATPEAGFVVIERLDPQGPAEATPTDPATTTTEPPLRTPSQATTPSSATASPGGTPPSAPVEDPASEGAVPSPPAPSPPAPGGAETGAPGLLAALVAVALVALAVRRGRT